MATEATSDMGVGLGTVFGILAVLAAGMMGVYSYNYAIRHARELETTGLLVGSGLAFGVAVVAGSLAIVAIHVYDG